VAATLGSHLLTDIDGTGANVSTKNILMSRNDLRKLATAGELELSCLFLADRPFYAVVLSCT
jgi:hypothetical protein